MWKSVRLMLRIAKGRVGDVIQTVTSENEGKDFVPKGVYVWAFPYNMG